MRSGYVAVYHNGDIIQQQQYKCKTERDKIISRWQRMYGQRWRECFLQINPDVDDEKIKLNGVNSNSKKSRPRKRKNIMYGKIKSSGRVNNIYKPK